MKRVIKTLAQLRADLPITRTVAYFETGSNTPVPLSTQQVMAELLRAENETFLGMDRKSAASTFYQQAETSRQVLANLLGVRVGELAWSYNTTTATRLAIFSFDWQPGYRLAISDVEHASTVALARGMAEEFGVLTTVLATGYGATYSADYFLEQLDRHLTPDHRLLILSHVAHSDGRRLPVAEAVQIAHERGVKVLIDGAQAVGMLPVDVAAVGADFYSGTAHKWLMGPAGVGFLVVAQAQLPEYNPNFVPLSTTGETLTAGELSELGTPDLIARLGVAYSISTLQQIGLAQIENEVHRLTRRLRDGLQEISGLRNAGPDPWELSSSITTVQLDIGTPARLQQLVTTLREQYRIVTAFLPEICGVRVSVAAFNTEEEIDRLLDALAQIVPTL